MKVVINQCYGGFSLSTEAMKLAIAYGAKGIKKITEQEYTGGGSRATGSEKFVKDADGYEVGWIKDVLYKDGIVYRFDDYDKTNRADPILVRIVEEMGDKANGQYAKLRIVDIPDDIDWEISKYDGFEHIAESHRIWG